MMATGMPYADGWSVKIEPEGPGPSHDFARPVTVMFRTREAASQFAAVAAEGVGVSRVTLAYHRQGLVGL